MENRSRKMPLEVKKLNENINEIKDSDRFETPEYAMPMLYDWLIHNPNWRIWESACGSGRMAGYFKKYGFNCVLQSDLAMGDEYNYFNMNPDNYDVEITNIPFSISLKWIRKAIERDRPFAFIIPFKSLEQQLCEITDKYKCQMIVPYQRIEFYTPQEGWYRCENEILPKQKCMYRQEEKFNICPICLRGEYIYKMKSSPQIKTMWFTRYFGLPETMVLYDMRDDMKMYPR